MLHEALQTLLILQDRDTRRVQLEKVLAHIPVERAGIERRIAAHRGSIEAAKKSLTDLELRRKELEAVLRDLEEQVQRYRNQQVQVKKNDEYQALGHEIELTESKIGENEEAEIRLLYELDQAREKYRETERELNEAIAAEQAQLDRLAERENQVAAEIKGAQAEVATARQPVPADWLQRYDRLTATVGLPAVVVLRDQKCGGCHLKVSIGVDAEIRAGSKKIITCDNCSRIVYGEGWV